MDISFQFCKFLWNIKFFETFKSFLNKIRNQIIVNLTIQQMKIM